MATDSGAIPERVQFALQIVKAGQRIIAKANEHGGSAGAAMDWLVRFAREDLATLGDGGLKDLMYEVARFGSDAGISEGEPAARQRAVTLHPADLSLESVARLQGKIKDTLEEYQRTGYARFPDIAGVIEIYRSAHWFEAENLWSGVAYQMAHLLGMWGAKIGRCNACGILFFRGRSGRSDRKFCSNRCQAKQYRTDHPLDKKKKPRSQRLRTRGKSPKNKGPRHATKRRAR